ncbi:flagellin [Pelagibacterium sp. H642]|uniref:flagellin N-terminal helical domain-containing protein n=1 Tax=Pelagibacterium sp. H642 TaxID=1881069 RepID=UPI002816205C|nr:flagellin [Pelagibacterium sp. H642]WMT92601.1 flagellin [Pelagibacterium sp. H642]
MSDITLSKAVRSNLLSLQNTADMMATTQNRLATGKKVNSALDNPTNFFTASSLNSRASDINALMDGMANGIQTIEAADNGLTAITKTLESMQSTLRQARQDKSFETASYSLAEGLTDADTLSLSGGAIGETAVEIELGTAAVAATPATLDAAGGTALTTGTGTDLQALDGETITVDAGNGNTASYTFNATDDNATQIAAMNTAFAAAGVEATASADGLDLANADGANFTVTTSDGAVDTVIGQTSGTASTDGVAAVAAASKTVDQLVSEINNNDDLEGKIRASNDNGNLRIENLSTQELNVDGATSGGVIDGSSTGASTIGGNSVRADLANQYNELRDQLDKLADDASFNGINLLRGDKLTITFNETDTSSLEIQSRIPNEDGEATSGLSINSASLGIKTNMEESDLDSDTSIDSMLADIKTAVNTVRSQASAFGSSLSVVENRQDFSKNMINTLETGASNLTLADANEEAANLLALQTRQQLSSTALSMASQQDQAVLRLF